MVTFCSFLELEVWLGDWVTTSQTLAVFAVSSACRGWRTHFQGGSLTWLVVLAVGRSLGSLDVSKGLLECPHYMAANFPQRDQSKGKRQKLPS